MKRGRWLAVALVALAVAVFLWLRADDDEGQPAPVARAAGPRPSPAPRWAHLDEEPVATPPTRAQAADAGPAGGLSDDTLQRLEQVGRAQLLTGLMERHAELAERTVEAYCRAAKAARETPLFPPHLDDRDAAPFFIPLIDWEGSPTKPRIDGRLHLPDPLSQRIRTLEPGTWPSALAADGRGLDYTWMQQALQFDHWDVGNDPRYDPQGAVYDATIPNFIVFFFWTKLRLASALDGGDYLQAAAEVRHLSALLESTGLLVGTASGVGLRGLENQARAAAVTRGLDVTGWPALDETQRVAYRSTAVVGLQYFMPGVSAAVMKRAAECAPEPCQVLAEGIGAHRAIPRGPSTEPLEALLRTHRCGGGVVRESLKAAPLPDPTMLFSRGEPDPLERFLDAGVP